MCARILRIAIAWINYEHSHRAVDQIRALDLKSQAFSQRSSDSSRHWLLFFNVYRIWRFDSNRSQSSLILIWRMSYPKAVRLGRHCAEHSLRSLKINDWKAYNLSWNRLTKTIGNRLTIVRVISDQTLTDLRFTSDNNRIEIWLSMFQCLNGCHSNRLNPPIG